MFASMATDTKHLKIPANIKALLSCVRQPQVTASGTHRRTDNSQKSMLVPGGSPPVFSEDDLKIFLILQVIFRC